LAQGFAEVAGYVKTSACLPPPPPEDGANAAAKKEDSVKHLCESRALGLAEKQGK